MIDKKNLQPTHYAWNTMTKLPNLPVWATLSLQENEIRPHSHDYLEVALVASGSARQTLRDLNGETHVFWVFQGDVFAIQPGEAHGYAAGHDFVLYNCSLRDDCWTGELQSLREQPDWLEFTSSGEHRRKRHLDVNARQEARRCLDKAIQELSVHPRYFQNMAITKITEFLITVLRGIPAALTKHRMESPEILKTISFMEEHPERAHSLEKLAARAAMGISTYTREFRRKVGMSPGQYLQKIRMEIAKQQLDDTDRSEMEIAELCGLGSANYLIRMFRRHYGMTPAAYRRKRGEHLHSEQSAPDWKHRLELIPK